MKFLTALGLLFLFFSCSGGGGKSIKLSELDQSLAVYENKEGLDGIKESVTYSVTGKKNYDEIFKESAKTAAILKQLNFALEQANQNPEETFDKLNQVLLKLNINPKKIKSLDDLIKEIDKKATPKDKEDLFLIYNLNFGIKKVPEIIKTSKKMKDDVTKLNPQNDFTGSDAMKIPNAVSGVSTTLTNIETSVKGLPKILKNSKNLTGNLITYLQSGTFDKNAVVSNDDTEETVETESTETDSENNKTDQTKTTVLDSKEVKVIISVIPNNDVSQNTVNIFKSGMENSLALKNYVVIPSELETNQCSSNDINCFIKIAKFSKADEIILVETQKIENKYMFKLKIINVEKNGISKSTSKFYDGDISNFDYLLTFAETLTNNMLGSIFIVSENNKSEKTEKEIIKKEEPKIKKMYELIVTTEPQNLDIFINGKAEGSSPLNFKLEEGNYEIKIINESDIEIRNITLNENKTVDFDLRKFDLNFTSELQGVELLINGKNYGFAPQLLKLKTESYNIQLKYNQNIIYSEKINLNENRELNYKPANIVITTEDDLFIKFNNEEYLKEAKFKLPIGNYIAEIYHPDFDVKKYKFTVKNDEKFIVDYTKKIFNWGILSLGTNYQYNKFDFIDTSNLFMLKAYLTLFSWKFEHFIFDLGGIGYGMGNGDYKEFDFHILGVGYKYNNFQINANIGPFFGNYFSIFNENHIIMNVAGLKLSYLFSLNKNISFKPNIFFNYALKNSLQQKLNVKKGDLEGGLIFGLGLNFDFAY